MSYMDEKNKKIQEQMKSEGRLEQTGIIDTKNFPQNAPDDETCKILDNLFSKNQLTSRQVKYCFGSIHITDYFDEYNYNGRKFIRCKAVTDQPDNITLSNNDTINKNKFYWIEVKPITKEDIHNDDNIKSCFDNELTKEEIKNTIISSDKPILIKTRNDNRVEEWLKKVFSCTMKDGNHLNHMNGSELNEYINSCYSNDSEFSILVITDIDTFSSSDVTYIWSIINDDNFPKNSKTIFVQKPRHDSLAEVLPIIPESLVTTIDITGENLTIKNYEPKINGKNL